VKAGIRDLLEGLGKDNKIYRYLYIVNRARAAEGEANGGTKPLTPGGRSSERSHNSEEDAAGEPGALRGVDHARLTLFGSTLSICATVA
jgi:hypothetical protein